MSVKFISYDGKYPNLCSGTLTYEKGGEIKTLPDYSLRSGGECYWDSEEQEEIITDGEWYVERFNTIDILTDEEHDSLLEQINENVPHGCCGGCM